VRIPLSGQIYFVAVSHMADISTALMTQLERSCDRVSEMMASDGLKLLQKVLREAGFDKSDYLKDYEIYAHTSGRETVFEIVLSVDSVEETDLSDEVAEYRKMAEEMVNKKFEEAAVKSFGLSSDGQVHRIASLRDVRRKSQDTKKLSGDTKIRHRDTKRGSESREFDHKAAAAAPRSLGAPRSMQIGRSGKLKLGFTRRLKATPSGYRYPGKDFEGIMKKFVDGMREVIGKRFIPEFEKIFSGYYE
jgi:hypothetical protein